MLDEVTCRENLKGLIVRALKLQGLSPETIGDDAPLFGGGLGLDSVDALELMVAVEKEYGLSIPAQEIDRSALGSVASLARFVCDRVAQAGSPGA
jgi:acyl carrier protein